MVSGWIKWWIEIIFSLANNCTRSKVTVHWYLAMFLTLRARVYMRVCSLHSRINVFISTEKLPLHLPRMYSQRMYLPRSCFWKWKGGRTLNCFWAHVNTHSFFLRCATTRGRSAAKRPNEIYVGIAIFRRGLESHRSPGFRKTRSRLYSRRLSSHQSITRASVHFTRCVERPGAIYLRR